MNKEVNVHIDALRNALRSEYDFEKAYFEHQQESRGLDRLIRRGECWFPITIQEVGHNAFGNTTVSLRSLAPVEQHKEVAPEDNEEETKFEYGTAVVFFRELPDGKLHYMRWSAQVSYLTSGRMVVVLPNDLSYADIAGDQGGRLGISLAFNERTYQLQFEALKHLEKAEKGPLFHLKEVLIGSKQPEFRSLPALGFNWLNLSQEEAVNRVIAAEDVMIVHGPPGTGKTTTLVEAIYETLRREPQVLVCAQSNAAVDWISSQLLDRAVPVLRIGNPTRVTDRLLASTYERQFQDHPRYHELWAIRRALQDKHNHQERDRLKERYNVLELEIRQSLFQNAKVIACTLAGAGHPLMQGQMFHSLFIDEAGQATEPACWVALRHAQRVIMAGDHCQLPPTLMSQQAMHGPLAVTLMERLATTRPSAVSLLTVQYRMHPDIMQFSSEWFYDGRLTAAPQLSLRNALDFDSALIWFDTRKSGWQEAEQTDGTSRFNREEAKFLVEQLEAYVDMMAVRKINDQRIDFGVISPYQAQIRLLRKLISRSPKLRPVRRWITVQTVDAFQGQERDVILISLVRANESGQIGFLQDLRRMNVAITRARHKVMIAGDAATLCGLTPQTKGSKLSHRFYRKLYRHIGQVGRIVEIESALPHEGIKDNAPTPSAEAENTSHEGETNTNETE